jgi:hypothetical protein
MVSECSEVSEYVSRWARWRFVCVCVKELVRRSERQGKKRRRCVTSVFADMVGVSGRTVQRWLANGVQSCNVNAERIVEISVELCPEEARRILDEDLARHGAGLNAILGLRQGVVASEFEVASS